MKKILITDSVRKQLPGEKGLLDRANFEVVSAPGNWEMLDLYRGKGADLIIALLEDPVMSGVRLCREIRTDKGLRDVSVIIMCSGNGDEVDLCNSAGATACLTLPLNVELFSEKVIFLLNIPKRESYRVLLSITVEGDCKSETFMCTSLNISMTGMLIETGRDFTVGDDIQCSFFLSRIGRVSVRGKIMRVAKKLEKTTQYGVRFTSMSDEARKGLESFIKKKTGQV